jgi:hypothetical protein
VFLEKERIGLIGPIRPIRRIFGCEESALAWAVRSRRERATLERLARPYHFADGHFFRPISLNVRWLHRLIAA